MAALAPAANQANALVDALLASNNHPTVEDASQPSLLKLKLYIEQTLLTSLPFAPTVNQILDPAIYPSKNTLADPATYVGQIDHTAGNASAKYKRSKHTELMHKALERMTRKSSDPTIRAVMDAPEQGQCGITKYRNLISALVDGTATPLQVAKETKAKIKEGLIIHDHGDGKQALLNAYQAFSAAFSTNLLASRNVATHIVSYADYVAGVKTAVEEAAVFNAHDGFVRSQFLQAIDGELEAGLNDTDSNASSVSKILVLLKASLKNLPTSTKGIAKIYSAKEGSSVTSATTQQANDMRKAIPGWDGNKPYPDGYCHGCLSRQVVTRNQKTWTCPMCKDFRGNNRDGKGANRPHKGGPRGNPRHKPSTQNTKRPRGDRPCRFYLKGDCTYGDKCFNSHEGKPKKIAKASAPLAAGAITQGQFQAAAIAAATQGIDIGKITAATLTQHCQEAARLETALGPAIRKGVATTMKQSVLSGAHNIKHKFKTLFKKARRWRCRRVTPQQPNTIKHRVSALRKVLTSQRMRSNDASNQSIKTKIRMLNDGGANIFCVPSPDYLCDVQPVAGPNFRVADATGNLTSATHTGTLLLHVLNKQKQSTLIRIENCWVVPGFEAIFSEKLARKLLNMTYVGPPKKVGFYTDPTGSKIELSIGEDSLEYVDAHVITGQQIKTGGQADITSTTATITVDANFVTGQERGAPQRANLIKQISEQEYQEILNNGSEEDLYGVIPSTCYNGSRRYLIACQLADKTRMLISTDSMNQLTYLHHCMLHANVRRVARMCKLGGITYSNHVINKFCDACAMAHVKTGEVHSGRPSKRVKTEEPDAMWAHVHSDISGPWPASKHDGYRYELLFVDRATRNRKMYHMRNMAEYYDCTEQFFCDVSKQRGAKVKTLTLHCAKQSGEMHTKHPETGMRMTTDSGSNYTSQRMRNMAKINNCTMRAAPANMQAWNGLVERAFQTIACAGVAARIATHLPPTYWHGLTDKQTVCNNFYQLKVTQTNIRHTTWQLAHTQVQNNLNMFAHGAVGAGPKATTARKATHEVKTGQYMWVGLKETKHTCVTYLPKRKAKAAFSKREVCAST